MENSAKKKPFGKRLKKKLKQSIYRWHKTLALITIVPMIFWCLSGIMHPFMAHFFKPQIVNEVLESPIINAQKIKVSLNEVLHQNKLEEIKNFRFVSFNDNQFYQIKTKKDSILYFNTFDGKKLNNGDYLYANWLSRYFLDNQENSISNHVLITEFNSQYKYVNRYLPVHKVTFDTNDAMEIYVETTTDKLATFNPKSRQFFIWFFDTFHNWSFIDAISNNAFRIGLMIFLLTIISLSAVTGLIIYGLFWKQFKKSKVTDSQSKWRKYHRQTGLILAFFTVNFAFSGGYHATKKLNSIAFEKMVYEPVFKSSDLNQELIDELASKKDFKNISLIQFKDSIYYRCQSEHEEKNGVFYVNSKTRKIDPTIDFKYAQFLAEYFKEKVAKKGKSCCEMDSGEESKSCKKEPVIATTLVTDFKNRDYGFVNKRLPVVKVAFESEDNKVLFIETTTSRLAAFVTDADRREGYSFAILHKFLFMDWAGKDIRDLTMVLAALSILFVGIFGLILLLRRR